MAAPTRTAMRILSPRLQCLHQRPSPIPITHQIRCLSSTRYSNPSKRGFAAAPAAQPVSFTDAASEQANGAKETPPVREARREREARRQYQLRRMRFAGMGLLMSLAGLAVVISMIDLDGMEREGEKKRRGGSQQLDASSEANATFQGKEVHVVGAGEGKRVVAQGDGLEIELAETGTSSVPHFPRTMYLPTSPESVSQGVAGVGAEPNASENPGNVDNQEEYTLVGLGIRTVMWIQVYVVGLYIRTKDISSMQQKLIHRVNPVASTLVPGEKDDLKKKLLDPTESRDIWTELLEVPGIKTAWRLSPTRSTDFGHLRDGFVTGINKRTAEAKKLLTLIPGGPAAESEYDAEDFGQSIQAFKSVFKGGKAPKGSILIMTRDQAGGMEVWYQKKLDGAGEDKQLERLGFVPDERISRLIWMNYLGGEKVSSEAARKGVVDGLVGFAGRPIGSVEARVT